MEAFPLGGVRCYTQQRRAVTNRLGEGSHQLFAVSGV